MDGKLDFLTKFILFFRPQKKRELKRLHREHLAEVYNDGFSREHLRLDRVRFELEDRRCREGLNKKIAIYSAYFGLSEKMTFSGMKATDDIDWYFISNNKEVLVQAEAAGWIPKYLDMEISKNVILSASQAKIPKAVPHRFPFLRQYDYLLYVDDKIKFDPSRLEQLVAQLQRSASPMALKKHPFLKRNILEEFGEAMLQRRYKSQMIQIADYINQELAVGRKLECGRLFATGIILRDMRHTLVNDINESWYEHILRCGIECQVAFDFVAQDYDAIAFLPEDFG